MDSKEIAALTIFVLSIIWMHFRVIIKKDAQNKLSRICLLDAFALVIVLIGFFYPKTYSALVEEDYIIEWMTFYAFALSGFIIAAHLWFSREKGFKFFSSSCLIPMGVAIFCLFVAGEEASWGQRIFAFKPPDLFLEQNYQQELNVHNLLKGDGFWGIQIESKHLVMLVAFVYGILFPLITRFISPLKSLNKFAPDFYLMPYFLLVITMEEIFPISGTGEACEMFLGTVFLIHVFDTYPVDKQETRRWNNLYKLSTLMVVIAILSIITPQLSSVIYGSDAEAESTLKGELQLLQNDFLNPKANKQKILRLRSVHKRVYTAVLQGYFHLPEDSLYLEGKQTPADPKDGDVRNDRKGYFLDPWNNPYWVYYYRKEKLVIFYSFGSNRKRDSDLENDLNLQGDDVGVVFNV